MTFYHYLVYLSIDILRFFVKFFWFKRVFELLGNLKSYNAANYVFVPTYDGRMEIFMKKFFTFLLSIVISLSVGFFSGFLSRNGTAVYNATAIKPPLSPPPVVFPIVWTILFVLMGISYALVITNNKATQDAKFVSTAFYILNLCINFLWPVWFFVFNLYWFAFIWLLLLLVTVIVMTLIFSVTSKWAAFLQIPYILWLLFAAYLNAAVAILN